MKQFEDFCNLEFNDSTYDPKMQMSQNDRRALDTMEASLTISNSHYEIALPRKNEPPRLQNNNSQAEQRLHVLQKDAILREKYRVFMDHLLCKNYARKMSNEELLQTDT